MENPEIAGIQRDIENATKHVEAAEAFTRLQKNPDFKQLFLDDYLVTYAAGLVRGKAMEAMKSEDNQRYIGRELDGIGFFSKYLDRIILQGNMAADTIEGAEATLEMIRAEEDEDA